MIASENGSKHVVKKLLEHGALVDQMCNVSCKPAICCAYILYDVVGDCNISHFLVVWWYSTCSGQLSWA